MKRYIKQSNRSYRYRTWNMSTGVWIGPRTSEVCDHVKGACRPDADPIFNTIAHEAAMNGLNHCYTGAQGVCFMQPTNHPRGYWSMLTYIANSPRAWRQDIIKAWKTTPNTTIARLCVAELIYSITAKHPKTGHRCTYYVLSDLGKAYLNSAKKWVISRR